MIWILYVLAAVATALGQGEQISKDPEGLRFNPHNRVYNYNEHDKREEEILEEFNSPDFHQPTLVLDYRYMRTGGRQYIQGPGGQYIILPYHIKSPQNTKFRNFDELLDYAQKKQLIRDQNNRENHGYIQEEHRHDDHHLRDHQTRNGEYLGHRYQGHSGYN